MKIPQLIKFPNPFADPSWANRGVEGRARMLSQGLVRNAGEYYSFWLQTQTYVVLHAAFTRYPHIASFHDLHDAIVALRRSDDPETAEAFRKGGWEVEAIIEFVARCEPYSMLCDPIEVNRD